MHKIRWFLEKLSGKGRMKIHYRQFIKLWILKNLGRKTFIINISTICTFNHVITIGKEYQYREGGMLEQIIIEDIDFKNWVLYVKVYFIESERRCECSHKMVDVGYMGMWRIWDKGHYDIEEWRRDRGDIDYAALDNLPVIEI